jgi:hypothetical protein
MNVNVNVKATVTDEAAEVVHVMSMVVNKDDSCEFY